jgi:hypothetical protein
VVIYDPNGGEADGDGWINSPPGAFTPNPRLSGRMNFTFAPRYAHGATIPTGKTQFDAPPAGLKFNATSYDWLVVNGDRAQVKGGGTIDGVGSYVFLLTAIDGKVSKSGPDRLRLKVWDRATGSLIYDNQPGAADSAQVAAVGGGRIAIDK